MAARSPTATLTSPAVRYALAPGAALVAAGAGGLLYAVIGLAGLAGGDGAELAGALRVTTASSVLALLLGLAGLVAGAVTATEAQPGRIERSTSSARARRPAG